MKKRILACLLMICMLATMLPATAFAAEDPAVSDSQITSEPPQEEAVCTCKAPCTEENMDSTCPVCAEDFTACGYASDEPQGDGGSTPWAGLTPAESVDVPAHAPMNNSSVYEVSSAAELQNAVSEIEKSTDTEATIVLTSDITYNPGFAGVAGKHITLKSSENNNYTISIAGTGCVGDITLSNVKISVGSYTTLYVNGHTFETTTDFTGTINSVYGGGPKDHDIEGNPNIMIHGGTISYLHGGGCDSAVNGDVSILIDGPDVRVMSLYGGGYAKETTSGTVSGDVTIELRHGSNSSFFGGGQNAYSTTDNEGDRLPASVSGTVTVTLGYPGAPDQSAWPGKAMYTYGGSYHSTVGNVVLNVTDGFTSEDAVGDRNLFGCGYNDTVLGTVEIHIYGNPDIGSSFIYGGGSSGDSLNKNWPVNILNQKNKDCALYVTYDVPSELKSSATGHGVNAGSNNSIPMTVKGNILVELKSGNMDFLVLDNEDAGNLTVNGNSEILIHEGRVAQVQGNKTEYVSKETDHTTTVKLSGKSEIGYFYRFDEIALDTGCEVVVDATKFTQFSDKQKPFYSVDYLTVGEDSRLVTQNNGQARILSGVTLKGIWEQKYSSGISLTCDDKRGNADLRIGGSIEVDGGTLISHGTTHVYNDLKASGGTLVFVSPAIIGMSKVDEGREFSVDGTKIYLPVIPVGEKFYPTENHIIRLAVGEKATGTADVYLFEGDSYENLATITDAHVGQNYINGQRDSSDAVFILKNSDNYYFKRVGDSKTVETTAYDMWQVAKGIIVTFDKNGGDTEASPKYIPVEWVEGQDEYQPGVPVTDPTRDGYIFKGWNTQADGMGDPYTAETKVNRSLTVYAQWEKIAPAPTYTVTYTDGVDNEEIFADQVTSGLSAGDVTPAFNGTPSRDGYTFTGWLPEVATTVTGTVTYVAQWSKNSSGGSTGGGGGTTYYILHYESNGGTEYKDERYSKNTVVKLDKVPTREGYTFTGWYADKELTDRITSIKMTSDKTVYAGWEPTGVPDWLNGKDHFAYVVGYVDGTVRPLNNISRAEVATIFFRLLNEDIREKNLTSANTFADVNDGMWCNKNRRTPNP